MSKILDIPERRTDTEGSRPLSLLRRAVRPQGTIALAGYPLGAAAEAVRDLAGGHPTGKIVLTV